MFWGEPVTMVYITFISYAKADLPTKKEEASYHTRVPLAEQDEFWAKNYERSPSCRPYTPFGLKPCVSAPDTVSTGVISSRTQNRKAIFVPTLHYYHSKSGYFAGK